MPLRRWRRSTFAAREGHGSSPAMRLHTDLTPDAALGGFYGWLLTCLGQSVGFPTPKGGPASWTRPGRAVRVAGRPSSLRCARTQHPRSRRPHPRGVAPSGRGGGHAGRAVLADVSAPALYLVCSCTRACAPPASWRTSGASTGTTRRSRWIGRSTGRSPGGAGRTTGRGRARRREYGRPEPFRRTSSPAARSRPHRSSSSASTPSTRTGHLPARRWRGPTRTSRRRFVTHRRRPHGRWDGRETEVFVARIEDRVEALAPGFEA